MSSVENALFNKKIEVFTAMPFLGGVYYTDLLFSFRVPSGTQSRFG
jgi:hypothetical protein